MADTKIYAGKEGIQELWRRIKSEIGKFTAFQKATPAQDGTPDVALADRKTNIIYLVLEPNAVTPDLYKEWIWTLPEEEEGEWICIGDTSVDLSGYALKSEMSVTQGTGVDADKTSITLKDGTSATVLNAHQDISGKVDKVDPHGVSGIIPSFSLTGDLMSSGLNVSDVATKEYCSETYKPKQTAVSDPTASGNAVSFIDSISQDANGVITATKKTPHLVTQDNTAGLMSSEDKIKLDGVSTGANKVEASATPGDGSIRVDGSSVSVYVHPTTAGSKHVPAGGDEHKILCYGGSSGVAVWDSDEYEDVDIAVPVITSVTIGDKTYPVVKIGTRYWMAENLDFKLPSSVEHSEFNPSQYYYVNDPDWLYYSYYYRGAVKYNYDVPAGSSQPPVEGHGLLYNWSAVKYISDNAETLLPHGWRVPTNSDLYALQNDAGGYSVAGTHLKAITGWTTYSGAGNGDDSFGFAALPTGYRNVQTASLGGNVVAFQNINESTGFWSSTEHQQMTDEAYVLTLRYSSNQTSCGSQSKKLGYPIRLVMDAE